VIFRIATLWGCHIVFVERRPGAGRLNTVNVPQATPLPSPKVIPFRKKEAAEERAARVGMGAFLLSWGMHFGALLLMYACTRWLLRAPEIFPMPELPWQLPLFSTGLALGSSAVLEVGKRSIARGDRSLLLGCLSGTIALGTGFVVLQALLYGD